MNTYEMTRVCSSLVLFCFWVGMLNAIQEVCKERSILKREYMTGLSLNQYILSKILVLGVLSDSERSDCGSFCCGGRTSGRRTLCRSFHRTFCHHISDSSSLCGDGTFCVFSLYECGPGDDAGAYPVDAPQILFQD